MDGNVEWGPVAMHRDHRGWVFEPVRPNEFPAQRNAHLVLSEPGTVRGNHYHLVGTEVMVVVGPALVRYREAGAIRDVAVPDGEAYRFVFPPRVAHAIQNTGDRPQIAVAFNTMEHDRERPDVVRDVLIVTE